VLGTRHIQDLQQNLLKHDGFLVDYRNFDPGDLARQAFITATSSHPLSFEQNDVWIPLLFPVAQQFPVYPPRGEAIIDQINVLMRNDLETPLTIFGGAGASMALDEFFASNAFVKIKGTVQASTIEWVTFKLEKAIPVMKPEDFANPPLLWFRLDSPDKDGESVFVGKDLDHYPGFRTAYYDEDGETWKVPRLNDGATYFTPVIKPRGVFNFKIPGLVAYPVENAIDGLHRPGMHGSNLWMSDPAAGFPQLVVLDLHGTKTISEIHVTTDTGIDKPYPHAWGGDYKPWPVPGKPPRCPKDFDVLAINNGKEKVLAQIRGNFLRKLVVKFSKINAEKVKLVFLSGNGGKTIGIYEIRVY
jgi:hypothetical protein